MGSTPEEAKENLNLYFSKYVKDFQDLISQKNDSKINPEQIDFQKYSALNDAQNLLNEIEKSRIAASNDLHKNANDFTLESTKSTFESSGLRNNLQKAIAALLKDPKAQNPESKKNGMLRDLCGLTSSIKPGPGQAHAIPGCENQLPEGFTIPTNPNERECGLINSERPLSRLDKLPKITLQGCNQFSNRMEIGGLIACPIF
jgi:hypothetical protein